MILNKSTHCGKKNIHCRQATQTFELILLSPLDSVKKAIVKCVVYRDELKEHYHPMLQFHSGVTGL